MKRAQCQAYVASSGERCKKSVRWGRKYCWWHYPKAAPVLGALVGMILTLLFNGPLRRLLSVHWPFYYLDGNAPVTVSLSPDVQATAHADPEIRIFSVVCRDDCSGLDRAACEIAVLRVRDETRERLDGELEVGANELHLTLDEELTHGEYILRTVICDRARNRVEHEYPFALPENDIVEVTIRWENYDEEEHQRRFGPFLDEYAEKLDLYDCHRLYVYHYGIRNTGDETYCRSVSLSLNNQGTIFCWEEQSVWRCEGVTSLESTQAMVRNLPEGHVFGSERLLRIDEMAPGGRVYVVALVGFPASENVPQELSTPREVGVFGTYVSEGFGETTTEHVRRWVPVSKRDDNGE